MNAIEGTIYLIAYHLMPYSTMFLLIDRNLAISLTCGINPKTRIHFQHFSILILCLLFIVYFAIIFPKAYNFDESLKSEFFVGV